MDRPVDYESVGSLQDEENKIKESIDRVDKACIAAMHTQDSVAIVNRDLLGERVVDLLSGQVAEVIGYDHGLKQYRIEFVDFEHVDGNHSEVAYWSGNHGGGGGGPGNPYEAGHSTWRHASELVIA